MKRHMGARGSEKCPKKCHVFYQTELSMRRDLRKDFRRQYSSKDDCRRRCYYLTTFRHDAVDWIRHFRRRRYSLFRWCRPICASSTNVFNFPYDVSSFGFRRWLSSSRFCRPQIFVAFFNFAVPRSYNDDVALDRSIHAFFGVQEGRSKMFEKNWNIKNKKNILKLYSFFPIRQLCQINY